MNGFRTGILIVLLLATVSGCVPTQRELRLEQDVDEMKRRLAETERRVVTQTQSRSGETRERLDVLARNQAEMQAELDTVRVDQQTTQGRLEDSARERSALREEISLMKDDLGIKISALEDRLAAVEEATRQLASAPPPSAAPRAQGSLYEQGLNLIRNQGEYARGRELLEEFLTRNPQSDLTVNAMYWIGEAYYGEKKYENAILQFQDVIQKYGDHPKAASALLKQGLTFHTLGDEKNARVILQRVIEGFPLSDEAKRAKEKLSQWNGTTS